MKDEDLIETEISSDAVYSGFFLNVKQDKVRLPGGKETLREWIDHPGAVVVVGVLDNGKMLFERQFRYPLHRIFLELPAGKIDPSEHALDTAKRELKEETGYKAKTWCHLGTMHPCIGYSNERIEIFLARGVQRESGQNLDHGEFLDLLTLSLDDALLAIRKGEITDSKTIVALFWAEKVLRCGW